MEEAGMIEEYNMLKVVVVVVVVVVVTSLRIYTAILYHKPCVAQFESP